MEPWFKTGVLDKGIICPDCHQQDQLYPSFIIANMHGDHSVDVRCDRCNLLVRQNFKIHNPNPYPFPETLILFKREPPSKILTSDLAVKAAEQKPPPFSGGQSGINDAGGLWCGWQGCQSGIIGTTRPVNS